jgi:hypothetical protein
MSKPESNFWQYLKKNTPNISWTRIENTSALGTPDLLGYNKYKVFFTVELKVAKRNIKFSPHQISFHVKHPVNSFILVQTLDAWAHATISSRRSWIANGLIRFITLA